MSPDRRLDRSDVQGDSHQAHDRLRPIVLRGASVIDGSGAPARFADLLLVGGRIAALGSIEPVAEALEIELGGLTLAPGFIDLHTHSDASLLHDGSGGSQLMQGVTLEVIGNCGHSCAPRVRGAAPGMGLGPQAPRGEDWQSFGSYLETLARSGLGLNVAALVGHGALRQMLLADVARPATPAEAARLRALLDECLDQGAIGLSSGLEYVPGLHADADELVGLCKCVARRGALYTTHLRNRDLHYEQGLGEALLTARRSGARLQVSHMTPKYGAPEHAARHMVEMVNGARDAGIDAAFDVIPHEWGPTMMASVLPAWVFEGGTPALLRRLRAPGDRARIRQAPNPIWRLVSERRWNDIVLFGCPHAPSLQGMTLEEVGRALKCDPFDAVLDVLADAGEGFAEITWLGRNFAVSDTARLLQDRQAGVISDAITLSSGGPLAGLRWSPSTFGWAARFLAQCIGDGATMALPEAVRRITALPAERLGLAERGRIAVGHWADLVAFDPAAVSDRSTLARPDVSPTGFVHVWVNGRAALRDGRPTSERAGTVVTQRS